MHSYCQFSLALRSRPLQSIQRPSKLTGITYVSQLPETARSGVWYLACSFLDFGDCNLFLSFESTLFVDFIPDTSIPTSSLFLYSIEKDGGAKVSMYAHSWQNFSSLDLGSIQALVLP
jgi:hypothetical protein